jgi:hypothetical protein
MVFMRHRATNSNRDSRTSPLEGSDASHCGQRRLDCGHEPSDDHGLVIRRQEREPSPAQSGNGSSALGEQQQPV